MKFLDVTMPTPVENLACDEALLDFCEETGSEEILRVWESSEYFVVVGYANHVNLEVNREACRARQIPILRRCSGGGTVVQGPGCLNYSLVLNFSENDSLQTITQTNRLIMERHGELFQTSSGKKVEVHGHTDLAMDGFKFSGNSQRRKKHYLLFHGALLLNFDLQLIEELLKMPSKQPSYRRNRSHMEFLRNLSWPAARVKAMLRDTWKAGEVADVASKVPEGLIAKYRSDEWNLKF